MIYVIAAGVIVGFSLALLLHFNHNPEPARVAIAMAVVSASFVLFYGAWKLAGTLL